MKLHNTVQNEPILSNVGEVGEFRIRNSAKAFNILSSGLYANKIRAIIRELSCNAVDSHVAAGKADTPFDVHLPNSIDPWFSIRDYGTGLNHEQVTNIYTTYFESTKTGSNDFIGALGLGSKSPFSYTDNFTVTTVKDGRKGIYTAFINDQGVPSIALMMEEETTDPNGVEIRFGVEDSSDFYRFRQEAREVYTFFKLRPVVSGYSDFEFRNVEYLERDIIPGVHSRQGSGHSLAIMGNIAYPIQVPNEEKSLGNLAMLLGCNLVMEFDIGELDFQASREGLSYIPETIQAIKTKLEKLEARLAIHIAERADKIDNKWERADYLVKTGGNYLWSNAVLKYAKDNNFELLEINSRWPRLNGFNLVEEELASKYNIVMRGFRYHKHMTTVSLIKTRTEYNHVTKNYINAFHLTPGLDSHFVINDTKVGALERAKYHWKNSKLSDGLVYVIEAFDKTKPIDTDSFFNDIENPPATNVLQASALLEKSRAKNLGRNVTILSLQRRGSGYNPGYVWRDAGKADSFSATETYYYLPLKGFECEGIIRNVKHLKDNLETSKVHTKTIYGVRRSDIEWVKAQKNWVNLDDHVRAELTKLDTKQVMGMVKGAIDFNDLYCYNATEYVNKDSLYLGLYNELKNVQCIKPDVQSAIEFLCKAYQVETLKKINVPNLIAKYVSKVQEIRKRYPLLDCLTRYGHNNGKDVAEYINAIDTVKAK